MRFRDLAALAFSLLLIGGAQRAAAAEEVYAAVPGAGGSLIVVLTPEQVQRCGVQGGCRVVTVQELAEFVYEFVQDNKKALCSRFDA